MDAIKVKVANNEAAHQESVCKLKESVEVAVRRHDSAIMETNEACARANKAEEWVERMKEKMNMAKDVVEAAQAEAQVEKEEANKLRAQLRDREERGRPEDDEQWWG